MGKEKKKKKRYYFTLVQAGDSKHRDRDDLQIANIKVQKWPFVE